MKFVDEVEIDIYSGAGGPGAVSFRREAMVPRGGPDGGDGGRGGHVYFEGDERLHSLLDLRLKKKYRAPAGGKGGTQNKTGADGEDFVIKVPPGTILRHRKTQEILFDIGPNQKELVLKGGQGGKGNTFYKSSVHQAPQIAQKGMPGEEFPLKLELKLIADVGLVGLPNAGKSTLISRISAARPKIADYPFTTLVPNLGVVRYNSDQSFVVADIPGLIEGAHKGVGLGIQFLKHVERTKVFIHVVDALGSEEKSPLEAYREIRAELSAYDKKLSGEAQFSPLSDRSEILILNKIDTLTDDQIEDLKEEFFEQKLEPLCVSAVTGEAIQDLIYKTGALVFGEVTDEE